MSNRQFQDNQGWLTSHSIEALHNRILAIEEEQDRQLNLSAEQYQKLRDDSTGIAQSVHTFALGQSDKWSQAQAQIAALQKQVADAGQVIDITDILGTLEAGKAEADAGIGTAVSTGAVPADQSAGHDQSASQQVLPGVTDTAAGTTTAADNKAP